MVYVTSAAGSLNENSIREQLEPWVTILEPTDAPLHSLLTPHPVNSRFIEYQVDQFGIDRTAAGIGTDAVEEAWAASDDASIYTSRLRAVMQINARSMTISGSDRASEHAGVSDPLEYRTYKLMTKVIQDAEKAMLFGVGDGPNETTRLTQGLLHWCAYTGAERAMAATVNATLTASTDEVINDEYYSYFYDAGGVNLDRSIFTHKILAGGVANGFVAEGAVGMCGGKLKALISEFALTPNGPINERSIPAYDKMFVDVIDAVETVYGTVYINWNRWMDLTQTTLVNNTGSGGEINTSYPWNETLLFMMPQHVKRGVFRGAFMKPLFYGGDADQIMVAVEEGLIVTSPLALTGGSNLLA